MQICVNIMTIETPVNITLAKIKTQLVLFGSGAYGRNDNAVIQPYAFILPPSMPSSLLQPWLFYH